MKPAPLIDHLPRLEPDGSTHRRDCACPRCDAGFAPSEAMRRQASARWQRKIEDERARAKAERAVERRREHARMKALQLELSLVGQRKQANDYVASQTSLLERLREDERLNALLTLRRAGKPIEEALAEVDERFPARAAAR